ncbi:helix-turn-helix domain-containing protein [Rhizobium sp. N541]|nr:helix-turn-helix domain-containing protein [Rhizobium sp. N324]ANM18172.1 helix-turn-helix domain-containing protein [Rhizobium sp. N541]ANM24558.1 helix-turn-helix domain-containing protein [Rhizobium sp. N941]OYD05302.1 helix-turn-helix domain-containing protein [Rhizobium sp. N4311]
MPLKPIRNDDDYEDALLLLKQPEADKLDILATLIDAYEAGRYPSICRIRSMRSSSGWNSRDWHGRTWNLSSAAAGRWPKFSTESVHFHSI